MKFDACCMYQHYMLYLCFSVTAAHCAKKYKLKNVPCDLYYDNCGINWRLKTLYREKLFYVCVITDKTTSLQF